MQCLYPVRFPKRRTAEAPVQHGTGQAQRLGAGLVHLGVTQHGVPRGDARAQQGGFALLGLHRRHDQQFLHQRQDAASVKRFPQGVGILPGRDQHTAPPARPQPTQEIQRIWVRPVHGQILRFFNALAPGGGNFIADFRCKPGQGQPRLGAVAVGLIAHIVGRGGGPDKVPDRQQVPQQLFMAGAAVQQRAVHITVERHRTTTSW